MNKDQAQALGILLRDERKKLGYSTYELAAAAGVSESTVVRIEQGHFSAPSPSKLARFAEALQISLADLYAKAGYLVPNDLPTFETYLHAKYPNLPKKAVKELGRHFKDLMSEHNISTDDTSPRTPSRL